MVLTAALLGASVPVTVYIDGARVHEQPLIHEGRAYLPARALAEALGCSVHWDGNTKTVHITTSAKADAVPCSPGVEDKPVSVSQRPEPDVATVPEVQYHSADLYCGNCMKRVTVTCPRAQEPTKQECPSCGLRGVFLQPLPERSPK